MTARHTLARLIVLAIVLAPIGYAVGVIDGIGR